MMLTHEEELLLMRHAHLAAERVKNGKTISDENIRIIKDLFPDVFTILSRISADEVFGVFDKFKDQQFFAREVNILLSPKGKELVARELQIIREYAEKNCPVNQGK